MARQPRRVQKLHCGKAVVDLEKWPEPVASWPKWLCCGVGFAPFSWWGVCAKKPAARPVRKVIQTLESSSHSSQECPVRLQGLLVLG